MSVSLLKERAIQWDDLHVFLTVAEAGSLGGAARRLRSSQATVWRRVNALEESLGVALFERRRSGYLLTHAGMTFLKGLEGVDQQIAAARRRLAEGADTVEGEVRVMLPEALGSLTSSRVSKLAIRHPRLVLELLSASPIAAVTARDADIVIRCERPFVNGFVLEAAFNLPFAVYASDSYLERHRTPPALGRFEGHSLIDFDYSDAHVAPQAWRNGGSRGARVVLRASSPHVRLAGARSGLGLAMLPKLLAGADPALREVIGTEVVGSLDVVLYTNAMTQREPAVIAARDFFIEVLGPSVPTRKRELLRQEGIERSQRKKGAAHVRA